MFFSKLLFCFSVRPHVVSTPEPVPLWCPVFCCVVVSKTSVEHLSQLLALRRARPLHYYHPVNQNGIEITRPLPFI